MPSTGQCQAAASQSPGDIRSISAYDMHDHVECIIEVCKKSHSVADDKFRASSSLHLWPDLQTGLNKRNDVGRAGASAQLSQAGHLQSWQRRIGLLFSMCHNERPC